MSAPQTLPERFSKLDIKLLFLTIMLGATGIAMLYSAAGGEWIPWAKAHAIRFSIGLAMMFAVALLPLRFWLKTAYLWFFLGLCLLGVVEVMGHVGMGAQRWIEIGGFTLQPSEFMKIAVILALARYFHRLHPMDQHRLFWMIPPLILIGLPVTLILLQPNLGTSIILAATAIMLWFSAGLSWKWVIAGGAAIAAIIPIAWKFLHDYQKQRVLTFLDPESDPLGAGYNVIQSIIAIGSGGLDGKGFIKGSQGQLDFLPEKHTDFIFTMLAEEFGFIGCMVILLLFTLLFIASISIAIRSKHRFGGLIAMGIGSMLWLHIIINIGMVMGLLPVVGVPLPFLSYGGTMLLASCIAVGLLQNIAINKDQSLTRHE